MVFGLLDYWYFVNLTIGIHTIVNWTIGDWTIGDFTIGICTIVNWTIGDWTNINFIIGICTIELNLKQNIKSYQLSVRQAANRSDNLN